MTLTLGRVTLGRGRGLGDSCRPLHLLCEFDSKFVIAHFLIEAVLVAEFLGLVLLSLKLLCVAHVVTLLHQCSQPGLHISIKCSTSIKL